ncbi:hypothetical protein HPHPM5_0644 [Helicobacter pylori Hp M5]|nr:hypothetical protein HPHPM5_0644 [Helicobacter pylori Hp M5]
MALFSLDIDKVLFLWDFFMGHKKNTQRKRWQDFKLVLKF